MSEFKWYVVRAISGREKKVKSYLEQEITRNGIDQLVPQVLIPSEKVYEMRNGKKRVRERNFFPGYILIQADLSNGETQHIITNTPDVIGFLGEGSTSASKDPVPLRQNEVNRILGRVDEMALIDENISIPFVVGETVKVINGPFNSFNAEIEGIDEQKKKLKLMVKIFGRKTPLELNFMQVEKI